MSDFWTQKVKTFFARVDINSDGVISKKDALDMADHLADIENYSLQQRAQIKQIFDEMWKKCMISAGSDDDGLLTASIMAASFDQHRNDPEFKDKFIKTFQTLFFSVRDVNSDGYLSEEEYARSFAGIGVQDTSFLHSAFEYMDLNQDGKINLAEYTSALWNYLATDDELLLWGPLV